MPTLLRLRLPLLRLPRSTTTPFLSTLSPTRHLATTTGPTSGGSPHPKPHTTTTNDELDIQSSSSGQGQRDRAEGKGGQAITQSDERDSNQRAKDESPEAPGPVLGMNDERGGKGH